MTTPLETIDRILARTEADVSFFERLAMAQIEIARLRRRGFACSAATMREQMLCELQAWLDPVSVVDNTTLDSNTIRHI